MYSTQPSALSVPTSGGYDKCALGDKSLARRWMLDVLESRSEKNNAGSGVRGSSVRLSVQRCEDGGQGSFEKGISWRGVESP